MIRKASTFALLGALAVPALAACQASFKAGGSDTPTAAPPPPPPPPPPPATTTAPAATTTAPPATTTPPATTPEQKPTVKGNTLSIPGNIEFDTGAATLKTGTESEKVLEQLRVYLVENPRITKLRIEGHTDNAGNAPSNETLSGQRALTIKVWLVGKGIVKERLLAVGCGQNKPIADNSTEEGKAKNRRTEFKIAELGGTRYLGLDPTGGCKAFD